MALSPAFSTAWRERIEIRHIQSLTLIAETAETHQQQRPTSVDISGQRTVHVPAENRYLSCISEG